MPDEVKAKISSSMKGKRLSSVTKAKISAAVKAAWAKVPKEEDKNNNLGNQDEKNQNSWPKL